MSVSVNKREPKNLFQETVQEITRALSAPFDPQQVRFKPAVVSGNRALALAYVDVRTIQDRLDDVLGVEGWQDSYRLLPDGSVMCRLRLRLGDEWVSKVDVGSPSEQPDNGDRLKAAFSDSLKRAAVKFGIGRYLYRLPNQWVDYDPQKRQIVRPPVLPDFAQPEEKAKAADKRAPEKHGHMLPANGVELQRRLYDYDAKLASQGICAKGELVEHVAQAGKKAGYDVNLAGWSGPAIELAAEETKKFEDKLRRKQPERKEVA